MIFYSRSRTPAGRGFLEHDANVTAMPEVQPVLYHESCLIGEGYARHAASAFMVFQLRRPLVWIQIGFPLIVVPLISTSFNKNRFSFSVAVVLDVVILVADVISWVRRRQKLINQLSNSGVAGTKRELSMTESTISIRTGDALGQTPYRHFDSAEAHGDFVFIRVRGSSVRSIVPRELFTDESLAFLRSRIA